MSVARRLSCTPDWVATADALAAADETGAGCFVINVSEIMLQVHRSAWSESQLVGESTLKFATVTNRMQYLRGGEVQVWLQVALDREGETLSGWVRVPEGVVFFL